MKAKHSVILLFFLLYNVLFAENPAFAVINSNCDNLKVHAATLGDEPFEQSITNAVDTWNASTDSLLGYCVFKVRIFS